MPSGKMTPKPSDVHRENLNRRAVKTMIQSGRPVGKLTDTQKKTPSQKHSESMRKKLTRGVQPKQCNPEKLEPLVINLKDCVDWGRVGDVRIDRATRWGNPFPLTIYTLDERNRVCDAYIQWFIQQEALGRLSVMDLIDAKRLGCWCYPLRCHGDYLAHRVGCMRRDMMKGKKK
jgi:hypothetical protein